MKPVVQLKKCRLWCWPKFISSLDVLLLCHGPDEKGDAINGGTSFEKKNEKHVEVYLAFRRADRESRCQA